jgi:hypothetical protein
MDTSKSVHEKAEADGIDVALIRQLEAIRRDREHDYYCGI